MPGISASDLIAQIDKILDEYKTLRGRARNRDLSDLKRESEAYVVRLRSAIERLAPAASTYIRELNEVVGDRGYLTAHRIRIYIGILEALRADADDGWFEGISELLHADTLGDFIEQAEELSGKGYENAAAVIVGSTLEAHLRLLCKKHGVNDRLPSGQPIKADAMNAELVKASAYNTLQQKAVTGWQAIRNAAAHAEYDTYTREQVLNMISSIRDFILAYPA